MTPRYPAVALRHNRFYDYESAFALSQDWLGRHPDDLDARSQSIESLFTTRRYAECREQVGSLAEHDALDIGQRMVLGGYEIAALLALSETSTIGAKLSSLIATVTAQPDDFTTGWTFDGTLHFVREVETSAPYRGSLVLLFEALQADDRAGIIGGLRQFQASVFQE